MSAISYLDVVQLRSEVFVGGLLTVSELGIPTEFIHSEQLRPSELQISLYGSTLGKYLLLDVLGKGLAEASQHRSLPLVVANRDLLPLGARVRRPVCCLSHTEHRPLGEIGDREQISAQEIQVQLNETRSPLMVRMFSAENFSEDRTLAVFRECASSFDLLEPLGRIRKTLESLQREAAHGRSA